jgi:DNA-binding transcriptional LysR family regulator
MSDNLRGWRCFVAGAEQGSFSRAAEHLDVRQPNLSRDIANLERLLGIPLFDRTSRGVSLTAPGAALLKPARDLLARLDAIQRLAVGLADGSAGLVRLGASSQTLVSFVAPLLGEFGRSHPDIDVQLGEGPSDRILAAVLAGEFDFGIVSTSLGHPPLKFVPLYAADIQVFVPRGDRLAAGRRIDVRSLADKPLLVPTRATLTRRLLDAACAENGIGFEVHLESESAEALAALVAEGYGTAVLPSTVRVRSKRIQRFDLHSRGRKVSTTMTLVWNEDCFHSRAALLLAEAIRKRASRGPPDPGDRGGFG